LEEGSLSLSHTSLFFPLPFMFNPGKLEWSLLLREISIGLLCLEQGLDKLWLRQLQVTVPGSLDITLWINSQRMSFFLPSKTAKKTFK
jgi:hypothetical protein